MSEQASHAPEDAGAKVSKPQPHGEVSPTGGDNHNTRDINLAWAQLRQKIDLAIAEGQDPDSEDIADVTALLEELKTRDLLHVFMEQEVIRELSPKKDRLTDKQLALALGVERKTLWNWRNSDRYQANIERIRREWRRKLDVFPIYHPAGIAAEIQGILNDPAATISERIQAIKLAATVLPGLVPADIRQEEEDAPGALIDKFKYMVRIKAKELMQRKKEEGEALAKADKKAQEKDSEEP